MSPSSMTTSLQSIDNSVPKSHLTTSLSTDTNSLLCEDSNGHNNSAVNQRTGEIECVYCSYFTLFSPATFVASSSRIAMNHSVSSFASRHRTPSFYPSTFCTLPVVLCIVLQQVLVIVCLLFQLCERARFPGFLYCCTGSYLHLFTLLLTRSTLDRVGLDLVLRARRLGFDLEAADAEVVGNN